MQNLLNLKEEIKIVYTHRKTYQTEANLGMIDITEEFEKAINDSKINDGIITGFTRGGVAAITILEFEPGIVNYDLKEALDKIAPYKDHDGNVIHYKHHETWHDDNGSSHIKSALLSPSMTIPIVNGKLEIGPWQNVTLVECDTRNRSREVVFQIIGE